MLAAIVLLAPYAGYFVPSPHKPDKTSLKLLVFNVNTANNRHAEVVDFVTREDADIAILQEVDAGWMQSLDALKSQYPHRFGVARQDNFGIVALSKTPFLSPRVRPFSPFGIPWLTWHIEKNGRSIRIAAAHTIPPTNASNAALRDDHLAELAEWAARPGSVLVAGDLNTTIFSPRMDDFFRVSGLRDSARGFGLLPTWIPFLPPLALPIDQVFATSDIQFSSRHLGPSMGSDHRPILVEFAPGDKPGKAPTR